MSDCIFCDIVKGEMPTEILFQDDEVMVFRDIHPKARVHLLVISRKHIPSLMEVEERDIPLLGRMMGLLQRIAKQEGLSNGFRTIINTGSGGGQEIDHLHIHLLGGGMLPKF
jgi:histidine triad (HIT) family protein